MWGKVIGSESLLQELRDVAGHLAGWLGQGEAWELGTQLAGLCVVVLVATALQPGIRKVLASWEARCSARLSWARAFFSVLGAALLPLSLWGLGRLSIGFFQEFGWEPRLLEWAVPFAGLWGLYRSVIAVLGVVLTKEQVRVWSRNVLLPLVVVLAVFHAAGVLDDVLAWRLAPRQDVNVTLGSVLTGIAVLVAFYVASRGVRRFLEQVFFPGAGVEAGLGQILASLATYTTVTVGAMFALGTMGIDLTAFTVVAGGLSVGLGFGLQEIVSNFMSGFILMLERSIGAGDVVQVGETLGVVKMIGVRSTVVRTLDNVELIIPNSRFLNDAVTNFTRADPKVRMHVAVGVSYDSDPREVAAALREASHHPHILEVPEPTVVFNGFGESSLDFELLVWTTEPALMPVLQSDLRYQVWDALAERGIEIPFPQRDIHLRSGAPLQALADELISKQEREPDR
jgi:potassium-dependent mechanosensitive channel